MLGRKYEVGTEGSRTLRAGFFVFCVWFPLVFFFRGMFMSDNVEAHAAHCVGIESAQIIVITPMR